MQSGFDVINDITKFVPGTEVGAGPIQRAQAFVKERGSKRIVRIVKDLGVSKISKRQFRSSEEKLAGYDSMEVGSIEEAERMLDE